MTFKYYKAPSGEVFGYDADEQDELIGAAIKAGWVDITGNWPPAPGLDDLKAAKSAEMSAACQAAIYAGFTSSALGAVYTYPAKDKDQGNLSGSIIDSMLNQTVSGWTTPFWCADANGVWDFRPHTAAQIQQVGKDGKAAILVAMGKNQALQTQIAAAATVDAVNSITWS